jgi:hypothetical protein
LTLPSNPWPRGIDTLQSSCQRVLYYLYAHFKEVCPINKERGNLFAKPLKKLKVKIKIEEATTVFKKL